MGEITLNLSSLRSFQHICTTTLKGQIYLSTAHWLHHTMNAEKSNFILKSFNDVH